MRPDPGFRVPRPLRTAAGDWVAGDPVTGGWVAWQWLRGEPASWAGVSPFKPRLTAASRAFHAALAGRPAGLALAVAAVDALMWGGASPAALGELDGEPELDQLLARALVYRLVTEIIFRRADPDPAAGLGAVARTSQPVTVLVLARLAVG